MALKGEINMTTSPNLSNQELTQEQRETLLKILKARFEKNRNRHPELEWDNVQAKLEAQTAKLGSLHEMERTGGEPDVVGHDTKTDDYIFTIVRRKVQKAAEVYATIAKRWSRVKRISRKTMR